MAEKEPIAILVNEIDQHPATLAWSRINGRRIPQAIEVLQQQRNKSEIYRLLEGTPSGEAIIAKRCVTKTGKLEQVIYEEILPLLPVSQLRYYGCLEETESEMWIFLEDAGEERFSRANDSDRLLAAHWLGALHHSARQGRAAELLPLRDPAYYLKLMRMGRENIAQNMRNPALTLEYIGLLKSILMQIDALESNWEKLTNLCRGLPQTLVHADFQPKNIRVRRGVDGDVLCVIDWEMAGWGIPIVDLAPSHGMSSLAEVDLPAYLAIAQEFWQNLDLATLRSAIHVGCVYRRLAAIYWASLDLPYQWVEKSVLSMEIYQAELTHALMHIFDEELRSV